MYDKFVMRLVWHNCKTYQPKEFKNDFLIATNGADIYRMMWRRDSGYFVGTKSWSKILEQSELENWWWADLIQTVQEETQFRE